MGLAGGNLQLVLAVTYNNTLLLSEADQLVVHRHVCICLHVCSPNDLCRRLFFLKQQKYIVLYYLFVSSVNR